MRAPTRDAPGVARRTLSAGVFIVAVELPLLSPLPLLLLPPLPLLLLLPLPPPPSFAPLGLTWPK